MSVFMGGKGNVAAFLMSDEGAYINGTIIPCDGGITINGVSNEKCFQKLNKPPFGFCF